MVISKKSCDFKDLSLRVECKISEMILGPLDRRHHSFSSC